MTAQGPAPPASVEPSPANYDFAFAVLTLDLAAGLWAPMGLVVGEEGRVRDLLRDCRTERDEGPGDADAVLERRHERTLRALETAFQRSLSDYLLRWARHVFLRAEGDKQTFLWGRLLQRERPHRTPPSLGARVRQELAREERPEVPKIPVSTWDRWLVAALGYPQHPSADGLLASSPMTMVSARISYVAFVRAWEKALARTADREGEVDALHRWGLAEARKLEIPPELVLRPGGWPPLPVPPDALNS